MFKIFNQKPQPAVIPAPKKVYSTEIEKIHHEFEMASDLLLQDAINIIENTDKTFLKKANRLKALGFTETETNRMAEPLEEKFKYAQSKNETIRYYANKYPQYKFIFDVQVTEICRKYNLVHGNVNNYTGFVPEENLAQIEKFSIDKSDVPEIAIIKPFYSVFCHNKVLEKNLIDCIKSQDNSNYKKMLEGFEEHFYINQIENYITDDRLSSDIVFKIISLNKKDLLTIAAPPHHMKANSLFTEKKTVPDPVVFHRVFGGYLIVTAWGDEANDPMVKL